MEEKRRNKRLSISVEIETERIDQENSTTVRYLKANVTDISKNGIGFESTEEFAIGATFTALITIWTGEVLKTVFKVVRKNEMENGVIHYGCIFVGMQDSDALKIEIYELLKNAEEARKDN
ncbi:MAG: PilZ domain-containing protein [Lachnospiraceae bacterium]|nr:PilZ domain-containing protein [Lachnospiraceae bacterium]